MEQELMSPREGLESSAQDLDVRAVVATLEGKRDEAIADRAEVESRWIRDLQQFEGNTIDRMTKGQTDYRSAARTVPPIVHITRTRTMAIAARIINMLVPSNERSWDIEPTPVPSMSQDAQDDTPIIDPNTGQPAMMPDDAAPMSEPAMQGPPPDMQGMQEQGQGMPPDMQGMPPEQGMEQGPPPHPMRPVTKADLRRQTAEEAEQKSNRMRQHMDDQLTEGRYNPEQRAIIIDGCKMGTGILEGPVVAGAYKKNRQQLPDGQWITRTEEQSSPQFKAIDPWNFYPLPAEDIAKCEGVFIDQLMNRREMQELKMLPDFDKELIEEVLREKPAHSEKYSAAQVRRANLSGETQSLMNRYSVWKYTGSLNRDDLDRIGIELDEELDAVDPIIEAWFVNGRLIKVKRHALEGAYRLPYYVWNYEKCDTSIFGYGVPYLMRDSDRVIQSTWHMGLHNAAITAGPQLVRRKGAVEPADGDEQISGGMKQWYLSDPEMTVNDAFGVFQINARIDELFAVHDRARQNVDEELGFPLIAQGEPTEAVPTSSGLAMLMNAANVVQRRIAQSYDDDIIEPSISALYDYNMTYLDDPDAKGDMRIRPMGATKLVVKDMQAQHLIVIANLTTNDRFAPLMKDDELLKAILKAAEIEPDSLMKSEEELSNQGPSEMEQAELALKQAEGRLKEAEANAAGMPQDDGAEGRMAELQWKYDQLEGQIQIEQMKLERAAIEASDANDVKLADIQSRFQLGERAEETKRMVEALRDRRETMLAGYTARLKAADIAMKKRNLEKGFDTYG